MTLARNLSMRSEACDTIRREILWRQFVDKKFISSCRKACRRSSSSSQRFRWLTGRVVLRLTSTRRVALRPRLHYTGLHRSVAIFIPDWGCCSHNAAAIRYAPRSENDSALEVI